ncbi:SDR family oxidoreductase [Streptomyces sp. 8L]|uniref:SDR family oxidoreductase n=1 Tax=Streptomyces sp. 8L TaxID=2877242 RepID=UPI001CD51D6A|nr:SDR family oxidoreductase [Streptomyces sp. 8L]MCA1223544.1 SDR family oxidoreductase [Streptomyces sp. 8L]
MSIAVTGSTGVLGSFVIDALLDRVPADRVVALARNTNKAQHYADRGVTVRHFDYDSPADLPAALDGVDRLLLISGSAVGQRFPQHQAVIDAAKVAGVGFFAYTSILHADTATGPVAPEHQATERLLADVPFAVALLRNGWYTENFIETAQQAVSTGSLITSAGDGRVSSATRQDLAEAAAVVLSGDSVDSATYELSGDVAWTHADLARTLSELSGRPVELRQLSSDDHLRVLVDAGVPEPAAQFVVANDQAIERGELGGLTDTLSKLIGHPGTSLADALRPALTQD